MASQPLEEILMLGWLSRLSFWWLCWEASTSPVSSASCPTNAGKPTMSSLVSSMPTLMHTSCRTPSRTASSWPTSRSTFGVHLQCSGQTSGCLDVIFTFHSSCGEGWKVGIFSIFCLLVSDKFKNGGDSGAGLQREYEKVDDLNHLVRMVAALPFSWDWLQLFSQEQRLIFDNFYLRPSPPTLHLCTTIWSSKESSSRLISTQSWSL